MIVKDLGGRSGIVTRSDYPTRGRMRPDGPCPGPHESESTRLSRVQPTTSSATRNPECGAAALGCLGLRPAGGLAHPGAVGQPPSAVSCASRGGWPTLTLFAIL